MLNLICYGELECVEFFRLLYSANRDQIIEPVASPKKNRLKGDVKNMLTSFFDAINETLKCSSSWRPRTIASSSGIIGISSQHIANPNIPKANITYTSKKLFRSA